jgi:hypothetical protein
MKLKFPKKITIGDVVWKIKYDKSQKGGSFNYKEHAIVIGIGCYKTQPTRTLNVIIHELKEIIHIEQDTRYDKGHSTEDWFFAYNHQEHTDLCRRLAGCLNEFLI